MGVGTIGINAEGTNYIYVFIYRTNGGYFLRKTEAGNYLLLYTAVVGTGSGVVGYDNYNSVLVSTSSAFPHPLATHASYSYHLRGNDLAALRWYRVTLRLAGGLGAGGGGLTLLDAGTWSVAGGYVLNTPVAGVEKL